MKRKITSDETQELFHFCEKHKVEHYDLQIELVDHLASYIEEKWETTPDLSFQDLLLESYGKFGIYKFSKITKQKEKELYRKYNLLRRKYAAEFYRWPKIVMTFAFSIVLFILTKLTNNFKEIYFPIFIISIVLLLFYYFFFVPKKLNINVVENKKFLILDYFKNVKNSGFFVILVPISVLNFFVFDAFELNIVANLYSIGSDWILFAFSFLMVSFYISLYSYSVYIPLKTKEHFYEQFPEFVQ